MFLDNKFMAYNFHNQCLKSVKNDKTTSKVVYVITKQKQQTKQQTTKQFRLQNERGLHNQYNNLKFLLV